MSNLLDKASVILTPTAYDNGEALCVKPSDGSGDFQFSRNSAATRVNAQGLVENVQILSSNLVQNGDFSEEGVQEVSNGSFSQEGVQQIVNGSFDTDTNWSLGTGWSISGGTANSDGINFPYIKQNNALISGKTYKLTFDITSYTSGTIKYADSVETPIFYSGLGSYTQIFTASSNNCRFQSATFNGSIDNVSVREVGQDWTLETGWSIGEDKASIDGTQTSNSDLTQTLSTPSGKSYKITYTISEYTSGSIFVRLNSGNTTASQSSVGTFTEYISGEGGTIVSLRADANFIGSVTNISVKEVGMDWSLKNGAAIAEDKATIIGDGSVFGYIEQVSTFVSGKKYKVTLDAIINSGGGLNVKYALGFAANIGSITTSGSYTFYYTAGVSGSIIIGRSTGGVAYNSSITNISAIEITDDTNLPRINYEGFSYQDALGSEVNSDVDFNNPSNWTLTGQSTVSNGKAHIIQDNTSNTGVIANTTITNKTYKITGVVSDYVSGSVGFASIGSTTPREVIPSQNGEFTIYYTSTRSTPSAWNIQRISSPCNLKIDNVSVKEYLGKSVVPNSGCGSWLFEPQSTNLFTYSEDFSNSYWSKVGQGNGVAPIVTDDYAISPDGTQNATRVQFDAVGNTNADRSGLVRNFSFTTGQTYSISCWVKSTNGTNQVIQFRVAGIQVPEEQTATSEWKLYTATFTSTATTTDNFGMQIRGANSVNESDILIYGMQLELSDYATSYIPTSGSTVTRNQDVCTNGGSLATINSTEGTLYFEGKTTYDNTTSRRISLSDGSTSNRVSLEFDELIENKLKVFITRNGASEVLEYTAPNLSIYNKIAIKWKANDFAIWFNGSEVVIVTIEPRVPVGLTELSFDGGNNANNFFGKTKAVAVWKEALSDQELADLTYPTPTDPTFTLDFDTIAEQFTFARGSEATYVDAQGLIQSTNEIGEELVVNGDFATDSDWVEGTGWSISNGVANVNNISANYLSQDGIVSDNNTYAITFTILNYSTGSIRLRLGNTYGGYTSGNGTYTQYIQCTGSDKFRVYSSPSGATLSIDNVSVKEVTTATNTPRLDYSTGAEAFLLEPQSTNLIPYSEDFSNSAWIKQNNITVLDNQIISPDGTLNSDKITTSSSSNFMYDVLSLTPLTEYTVSFYLKNDNAVRTSFWGAGQNNVDITWSGKNIQSISGAASYEYFGNDWYKVSVTQQSTSNGSYVIRFYPNTTSTTVNSIYLWGFQVEQQSYPTSYIPSNGSQTTRNQETCINATPEINSEEGVLYFEGSALADATTQRWISLGSGGNANRVSILFNAPSRISCSVRASSAAVYETNFNIGSQTNHTKAAIRYKNNDFAFFVNGVKVDSQSSGTLTFNSPLSELAFDSADGGSKFFGNTKNIQVYPKALSDAELINLTTI